MLKSSGSLDPKRCVGLRMCYPGFVDRHMQSLMDAHLRLGLHVCRVPQFRVSGIQFGFCPSVFWLFGPLRTLAYAPPNSNPQTSESLNHGAHKAQWSSGRLNPKPLPTAPESRACNELKPLCPPGTVASTPKPQSGGLLNRPKTLGTEGALNPFSPKPLDTAI